MPDLTAPSLLSSTVSGNTIVLTFSETIAAGSGLVTITDGATQTYMGKDGVLRTRLIGATDTHTIDIGDTSQVTVSGNTVTISVASSLAAGKMYSVQMPKGALHDAAGNSFSGLADTSKLKFTASGAAIPSATVDAGFSMTDTGYSLIDFITNSAAQTISGHYTGTLAAGEFVEVSLDNGATWHTASAANNMWSIDGTLTGSSTIVARVGNAAGGHSAAVRHAYTFDTAAPTVESIELSDTGLVPGETATVTVTFQEAVAGLELSDFTAGSGTLANLQSSEDGKTWTATFTPSSGTAAATNVISLDMSGVTDLAGNIGAGSADSANYAVDTASPVLASIAIDDSALRLGDTATVTFTFSEAVTGFTADDVTVANGALSALSSADGGITWTATLTPATGVSDSTNVVTVDLSGVADSAGNAGSGTSESSNYAVDTVRPTATMSLSNTSPGWGQTATVTLTFSEVVTGLTAADFTVDGGTLSNLQSSNGINWTATLTPATSGSGSGSLQLAASGVTDASGNSGPAAAVSTSFSYVVPPTVTVTSAAMSSDSGSSSSDFITNVTAQTFSGSLSAALGSNEFVQVSLDDGATWHQASVTGTSWTLSGQTLSASNTLLARVSNGDATGAEWSQEYTLDQAGPSATITLSESALLSGETATVTITFSEAVTGLTLADFKYSGTMSGLSSNDDGTIWTATLTPASNGAGEVRLDALAVTDLAGNTGPSADVSASFTYNATPSATIETASMTDTNFADDFITSSASQIIAGTLSESLARGEYVEVSLDNGATWTEADTTGTSWTLYGQTISASSTLKVRVSNGAAAGTEYSHSYTLDQAAPTLWSMYIDKSSMTSGESTTLTVLFDEAVYGLTAGDFTVSGATLGAFTTTDYLTWTATLTPTASGSIALAASTVTDAAGNVGPSANSASLNFTFTADTTGPSATLTLSDNTLVAGQTATLTVTFSEAVTDTPTAADFTVTGGALGAFTSADGGTTWTATLTPTANAYGEGSVQLNVNTIDDPYGNPGPSSAASLPFNYDTQTLVLADTLAFSSDTGDTSTDLITNVAVQTISGSFSGGDVYAVMGGKIEVSVDNGATWSSATVDNTTHTWTISKTLSGSNNVRVRLTDSSAATSELSTSHYYTIDTTAPGSLASKAPDLEDGSDTSNGLSGGTTDNVTSDTTPTVSYSLYGSGLSAGDYVDIVDTTSNSILHSHTITSSDLTVSGNSISAELGTLSAGSHTLVLRARDVAGNLGTQTESALALTIDTSTASMASKTVDLLGDSDTGDRSTDNLTSEDTPTVVVNVANTSDLSAGDVLQIIDTSNGDAVVGTYTLTADDFSASGGDIEITLSTSLDDGAHALALRVYDKAGNYGTQSSTATTVTVDTVAPSLSSSTPSSAATGIDSGTTTITLTFDEALDVSAQTGFKVTNSGNPDDTHEIVFEALSGNTGSYDGGTFTVTLTLSGSLQNDAHYVVTVYNSALADKAGNAISIGTELLDFYTKTTPSTLTLSLSESTYASNGDEDIDFITNDNTLTVCGITTSHLRYKLSSDDLTWTTVDVSGSTYTMSLPDSIYYSGEIQFQQYDEAGLESATAVLDDDWTVDTTGPTGHVSTSEFPNFYGLGTSVAITSISGTMEGTMNLDVEFVEYTTDGGVTWTEAASTTSSDWTLTDVKIASGGEIGLRTTDVAGNIGSHDGISGYTVYFGDGYGGNHTATGGKLLYTLYGNDTIDVSGTGNTVYAGYGNDAVNIQSGSAANEIDGGDGSDTINVNGDDNVVDGGADGDVITVIGSHNTVSGGNGDDTITISGFANDITGGSGNNAITISGSGNDVVGGSDDDYIIITGSGNDIDAGDGYNLVDIGGSGNTVTGGAGIDQIAITGNYATVSLGDGADIATVSGTSNAVYGGEGVDTISVSSSGNGIFAGDGDDGLTVTALGSSIYAGNGDDTIMLYARLDGTLSGLIDGGNDSGTDILNLYASNQTLDLASLTSNVTHIEKIYLGTNNALTITGASIQAMSDTDSIRFEGDSSDTVYADRSLWESATWIQLLGYSKYQLKSDTSITFIISNDITLDWTGVTS